jgi:hypothetical protein
LLAFPAIMAEFAGPIGLIVDCLSRIAGLTADFGSNCNGPGTGWQEMPLGMG